MDLNGYAIWDLLKAEMPEGGLEEIAETDYRADYEEHLARLRDIVRTGSSVVPMDWCPGEVLSLYHWGGDHVSDEREAILVLCCCVVLLAEDVEKDPEIVDVSDSACIAAIHCASTLGPTWQAALLEFLSRAAESLDEVLRRSGDYDEGCPAYFLGCLILASLSQCPETELNARRDRIRELHDRAARVSFSQPWEWLRESMRCTLWRRYLKLTADDIAQVCPPLPDNMRR